MEKIFYGKQFIDDDDIKAVVEVLKSDFLTQGPKIEEFEKKLAEYCGKKYAVTFCNGTAALHGAYFAAGVEQGDEVITTPVTFLATANAALYLGAKPIFVDVDMNTYCIDDKKIEEKITSKTKVITPVSYGGYPLEMEKIKKICFENKIVLIEDAAHSLGAERNGEKTGKAADMTMFSFHPIKHITTGEGGVIVTDNEEYAEKMKLFRSHGITKDEKKMKNNDGGWYYEMKLLGYNYRMTDIQAALGISQLEKIEKFIERRREIASIYDDAFKNNKNFIIPPNGDIYKNSYHLYPLLIKKGRNIIYEELKKDGIYCQVNYIPVHMQPYYSQKYGYKKGDFENAEKFYEMELSIPMHFKLKNKDIYYVIEKIVEKIEKLC